MMFPIRLLAAQNVATHLVSNPLYTPLGGQQQISSPKAGNFFDPKANVKALFRLVLVVICLLGAVWLFIRFSAGGEAADRVASTVLRQRVNLVDAIENLPASSYKALPLSLPYTGSLSVDLTVRNGNGISIFLISPDQIEKIKSEQNFQYIVGFEANDAKNYRRSSRLEAGTYYLVLRDSTMGILSESSSDIQLHAHLDP